MNKSRFIDSKFFSFMDISYRLVRASLLFWLYLGKGFFIGGLVQSACTLIEVIDEIFVGNGMSVRKLFKEISPKYTNKKRLSAIIVFIFIYIGTFIVLPFPTTMDPYMISVIKFVCIYAFMLAIIFVTYFVWNLVYLDLPPKRTAMISLFHIAKQIFRSFLLLAAILVVFLLIQLNFLFFVFFAPAIYGTCARFIFTYKSKKQKEEAAL
ncbi:hypothetical protein CEQ21_16380 [Niallia circulans]|uniref:DUF624 domain-containing protein n=1 Tax=Niallia circulans TaxID=1397 RepID=A0A553SJ98_NIACI|nr:hypothetical protein [Niallia circulans]TRZ37066.1 hypothetical protein CEQ21_16380 [Niallia circulans]